MPNKGDHGDSWRWRISAHPRPTGLSIVVAEPCDEAKKEREKKINEGARVVPFGFGPRDEPEPQPTREPLRWEGDDG